MGSCLSKKGSEPEHIGHRHHAGVHNHKNHEPFVNQSKPSSRQPYQLSDKHAAPQAQWKPTVPAPSPKPVVHRSDTILGKPFEDVRQLYTLGKELGRGQFGVTYLCTENSTGLQYACKSISKRKLVSKSDKEDIRREIQIMQHLSGQPNIIEFKGAYEDKHSVHVVMELCAGGELFDRIIAKGHYSERAAASICRQIVNVVHICHFMGVMHRDLKSENFLFSSKDEKALLKATDFGLSVFIEEGKVYRDIVGSAYYVAPEVLRRRYGKEIDIWSAGVILYILLSGVPPFWAETEKGIFDAILQGHIDFESHPWPSISSSAKDLVRKMLIQDPKKRITSTQVLGSDLMEDRNSIARQRSGIWKSLRDGDFEEEEIWDVLKNKHDYNSGVVVKPKDKKLSSLAAPRSIPTAARMIPRSTTSGSSNNNSCSSSSHDAKFLPQSAPVNIPHWSNIHRNSRNKASKNVSRFYGHSVDDEDDDCDGGSVNCDGDSDDGDEYDYKLPPHEFIAKRLQNHRFLY